MQLLIECTTEDQDVLLQDFSVFVYERLEIANPPSLTFVEHTGATSFGSYQPSEEAIIIATEGRHISDILRTLGHELVHHKQLSEGENGMTLEQLEYEANAVAGMLMRDYNKLHPEMFGLSAPTEPPPGSIADSQGATFPDVTRPSGPIEMGEDIIIELSNKTLSNYKKQAGREVKAAKRDWYSWKNDANRKPAEPFPKTMLPTRQQGIETASKKLQARYALDEAKIKESDSDALKLLKLGNQALRAFPSSPRQQEIQKQIETLRKKMKKEGTPQYHQTLKEDGVVNSAGSGAVAGIGIGPDGEPGVSKKKKSPIMKPMVKRFKQLREEFKDPAVEARKKLAAGTIPVDAKTLLARRKLVAQIDAKKKGNLP